MKNLVFAGVIAVAVALAAGAGETAAPGKQDVERRGSERCHG